MTGLARAASLVLIVVPSGDHLDYTSFENRLRSELVAAGFQTLTETVAGSVDRAVLSECAARFSATLAISISISESMVSGYVYIAGSGGGADVVRAVPEYPVGEQAPSVFAVKATDVLHGALLELQHSGSPPAALPGVKEATQQESKPQRTEQPAGAPAASATPTLQPPLKNDNPTNGQPQPGHWGVALSAALNLGLHSLPIALGSEIGLYRKSQYWGASLEGSVYLPATISRSRWQAEAQLTQLALGGSVQCFQPLGNTITLFESVGSGVWHLGVRGATNVRGTSTLNLTGNQKSSTYAYTYVGVGLLAAITDRTSLAFRFNVLAPWKHVDIVIYDQVVASVAIPALIGDLGLRLAL
jgi:hypothetical protein